MRFREGGVLRPAVRRLPLMHRALQLLKMANAARLNCVRCYPGSYQSPIPCLREVRLEEDRIFAEPLEVRSIDLRAQDQLLLVDAVATFYAERPWEPHRKLGLRYWFDNGFFSYGDGLTMYGLLRRQRPSQVVEIGSGFSSALMLDVNDIFLGSETRFTFVDPDPGRLLNLVGRYTEGCEILAEPVQQVDLLIFDRLGRGDMLVIDSSHVSKIGSDVNWLFFEVFPRLSPGVWIHLHDIFWPFEYPPCWVYSGMAANEAYVLRAFLLFNDAFQIRLFNSYLAFAHRSVVAAAMPLWERNPGGSLWLERT